MGRSVAVPTGAYTTVFLHDPHGSAGEEDSFLVQDNWEWFIEDLTSILTEKYPSLCKTDRWLGNEEHVVLENDYGLIVVCEYCGMVSVSLVVCPKADNDPSLHGLAHGWCDRVAERMRRRIADQYPGSAMVRTGFMSNGCGVYARI